MFVYVQNIYCISHNGMVLFFDALLIHAFLNSLIVRTLLNIYYIETMFLDLLSFNDVLHHVFLDVFSLKNSNHKHNYKSTTHGLINNVVSDDVYM